VPVDVRNDIEPRRAGGERHRLAERRRAVAARGLHADLLPPRLDHPDRVGVDEVGAGRTVVDVDVPRVPGDREVTVQLEQVGRLPRSDRLATRRQIGH
jgi:hypothetical protein